MITDVKEPPVTYKKLLSTNIFAELLKILG